MNKEITEAMVKEFMSDLHPHNYDAWLSFKASKQKQNWEVTQFGFTPLNVTIGKDSTKFKEAALSSDYIIRKIQRESDFLTVDKGYEIAFPDGSKLKGEIERIENLQEEGFSIYFKNIPSLGFNPNKFASIVECKEVLFVSEDGNKIYNGETVALLSIESWLISFPVTAPRNPFYGNANQFKYFSTKDAADEYKRLNQPYTLEMIREALMCGAYREEALDEIMNRIERGLKLKNKE